MYFPEGLENTPFTFKFCDTKIVNKMSFLKIIYLYKKKITMDMNQ